MSATQATKETLIAEIKKRVSDKILEQTNADLLIKLINNADSLDEAINIAALGTTYRRTGLHFDKRLEKMSDTIKYFKKNEKLSFHTDDSKPTHKLIIGDNYEALQNLLIQYRGKVDVIYIDPPYGKDSMGEFAQTNYNNAITRDNLLSMLYPRLTLAKQLLSDDGVIFCSIDDKNQAYVKCLFDEVFGERDFVAMYLWKKTDTPPSLSNKVRKKYEYVLCYGNNLSKSHRFSQGCIDGGDAPLLNNGNSAKRLKFPIGSVYFKIPDGSYSNEDCCKIELHNEVIVSNGYNSNAFEATGEWKWSQNTLDEEIKKGTYFIVKSKKFSIRYQRDNKNSVKVPQNDLNSELGIGTNEEGNSLVESIFFNDVFDNPKPISLIEFLTNMVNLGDDLVVLDFFAGSGTTGHAILDLNKQDEGNRTFIVCQLDEDLDTAFKKNTIEKNKKTISNQISICNAINRPHYLSEITAERLRRVMKGESLNGSKDFEWIKKNEPYGGNLDVYEIESVANFEWTGGKTPFDVIDETLYGKEKFKTIKEKIDWVCGNFDKTQKYLEEQKKEE